MTARVAISGFAEVAQALEQLKLATGRAVLRRAGLKAMAPTAELARSLAPVGEGYPEAGELRDSIAVGATLQADVAVGNRAYSGAKRAGGTDAEALIAKRDALRAIKGTRPDLLVTIYMGPRGGRTKDQVIKGIVQEFGSSSQEPQPYLRPALDMDRDALIARFKIEILSEIGKSVARSAKRAAKRG